MTVDPAIIDQLGASWQHPVDILEPEEESQRHADRVRFLKILSHAFQWVSDAKNPRVGLWQAIYAIGTNQATTPMAEVAASLGVERATISRGAVSLCRALDLPPSPAMRSEAARQAYRQSRRGQLSDNEHGNDSHQPTRG